MYDFLAERHLVIYPGKLTVGESFRIGTIGDIYPKDIINVVNEIKNFLIKKQIPIPVPY